MSRRVEIKRLALDFGKTKALLGVDLVVEPGEFFVLLGPSGCGKTTLLRSIAGLERPQSGSIKLGAELVTSESTFVEAVQRKLGFVFQDLALWPHLSAIAHLAFALGGSKKNHPEAQETLGRCHIGHLANRKPDQLSGGERQRLALARALATSPDLILMDEPMSSLDPTVARELRDFLLELVRERGMTVVYVTHQQEEAFELADRIGVMRAGRIEQIGTPEEIFERPASGFVAEFVGAGALMPAQVENGKLVSALGRFAPAAENKVADGRTVQLVLREGMLEVQAESFDGGVSAAVRRSIFRGDYYLSEVEIDGQVLRAKDRQARQVGATLALRVVGLPWAVADEGEGS
ncbi:MAG: ABC transporter ATP-binding protein [Planctomycetota bacterium]